MRKTSFIIFSVLIACCLFSGCATTRALQSAQNRVIELEQLGEERAARLEEQEQLNLAARGRAEELRRINEEYIKSERARLEADKLFIDSLTGIFKEGADIIERLIEGFDIITKYLEDKGLLVEDLSLGPGSNDSDNNS